jgi:putative ABC transport system permease protein
VFFTLLLLSGNTMMQAVRERTSELAVMKTIGFSSHSVLAMVLAESVLLLLLGGVIGLGLAMLAVGGMQTAMGGGVPMSTIGADIWIRGVLLMVVIGLLVGALPGLRAMRLNIVDALAGR